MNESPGVLPLLTDLPTLVLQRAVHAVGGPDHATLNDEYILYDQRRVHIAFKFTYKRPYRRPWAAGATKQGVEGGRSALNSR